MALFEISINQSNNFISFISPIIGIIISAFIAWHTYRQKYLENEINETFSNFTYMFSLFCKNFEELHNIKYQITKPALQEINNFLENLNEIERYLVWAIDNGPSPINIEIPSSNIETYAKNHVSELSKKMVLSISTKQLFTYIDNADITKEVTLLSKYGNLFFSPIYNRISTNIEIIKDIQETIKIYNEENINKPRSMYVDIKVINDDKTYRNDINKHRGQMLYRKSLFESYDKTVSRCLIFNYHAICHLEAFIQCYLKKYKIIQQALNIPYETIELNKSSLFNEDELKELQNSISEQEKQLFKIPEYKNLKKTFFDRFKEIIFYHK